MKSRWQELLDESGIPEEHKAEVSGGARRYLNMCGGRPSDCMASEIDAYRANPEAYLARREQDHADDRRTQELERAARWGGRI